MPSLQQLCPPDDGGRYARPACTHRTCKYCGVGQLRDKLNPLLQAQTRGTVTWHKWEIDYLPARADSEIKESSQDKDRDPGGTCIGATAGGGIHRTTYVCCQLATGHVQLGKTTSVLEH